MATTLRKLLPAGELPASWREEGRFAPDDQVRVTVEAVLPAASSGSPLRFLGAGKGLFASVHEVDDYIRRQRDAWES
jgi:hypothetical protein